MNFHKHTQTNHTT